MKQQQNEILERKQLQFYADKENHYTNRLFTFKVNNEIDCFRIMLKFAIANNVFRFASLNVVFQIPTYTHRTQDRNLKNFVDYFNQAEYDKAPTLEQALNDYRLVYGY